MVERREAAEIWNEALACWCSIALLKWQWTRCLVLNLLKTPRDLVHTRRKYVAPNNQGRVIEAVQGEERNCYLQIFSA